MRGLNGVVRQRKEGLKIFEDPDKESAEAETYKQGEDKKGTPEDTFPLRTI